MVLAFFGAEIRGFVRLDRPQVPFWAPIRVLVKFSKTIFEWPNFDCFLLVFCLLIPLVVSLLWLYICASDMESVINW